MDAPLDAWIAAHGHVAHTRAARNAGYSPHRIAAAVAAGAVLRVRRSWLVHPTASPEQRAAAAVGGRLSCVSAAVALGLWVSASPRVPHVSVPGSASHVPTADIVLHWSRGPVPQPRTDPHEHIVNTLFQVARCLPRGDALIVWESALRKSVVDADVLQRVRWRSTSATELALVAGSLSDSGIETAFVSDMRAIGLDVRQQVWVDGHPLDALIGERLGVQLDGFAHHQASERRRDLRADARLALRGYTLLRFDYHQVLFERAYVIDTVRTAMAQGLHRIR